MTSETLNIEGSMKTNTPQGRLQGYIRNRIAGLIFGRYELEKLAHNYMTKQETYIKGIEIIHWGEIIYLILIFLIILNIAVSFYIAPFLIVFSIIYVPILLLVATELELIMLTDERVLIEKRTLIEKITRTQQFQSISLDQIAMISYARAPPNILLVLLAGAGLIFSFLPYTVNVLDLIQIDIVIITVIPVLLFLPFLYLLWFGLRLTKRSIELSVIGLSQPIGIGRIKGAPVWFLTELQSLITERIHHIYHEDVKESVDKFDLEMKEFPLQFSSLVKDLVKEVGDSIAKALLMQLDRESLDIQEIYNSLPSYTTEHLDTELGYLKSRTIIVYNPEKDQWELNRNYLHEEIQQGL